ncbi:hypothetical protein E4T56_gene20049 [Termitomyces sp. T112]|nr:hypothetical protein E4T56_gene20049 [Termitomyces sp. T112]
MASELYPGSYLSQPSMLLLKRTEKRSDIDADRKKDDIIIQSQTRAVKEKVRKFPEAIRFLLDTLDGVSKVHPFLEAAYTPFKAAVTLELKRQENDAKVKAIRSEMNDVMETFLPLKDVKDSKDFKPSANLETLVKKIGDYIYETEACFDYYFRRHKLTRYIMSPNYEAKFAEYALEFTKLRGQVQLELSVLNTLGISVINAKLDLNQQQMEKVLACLESPRDQKIRKMIQDRGGHSVIIRNEKSLKEVYEELNPRLSEEKNRKSWIKLCKELSEDLDEALKRHLPAFQKKLLTLEKNLTHTLEQHKDQIITTLTGSFEQIQDPHIRNIWKEMQWKSIVKARNFVLALRDYYLIRSGPRSKDQPSADILPQELSSPSEEIGSYPPTECQNDDHDDKWALAYLNVSYLQAISEAIDDDASGFIHFREVNEFTSMCPEGWSLQQWLAYWAAGWHSSIIQYADKISYYVWKFYELRDKVRLENLAIIDYYLCQDHFDRLQMLLRSVDQFDRSPDPIPDKLKGLRDEFCNAEEEKLKKNLGGFNFNIDSDETLVAVTGRGRIERYIFPLIYVVLQRHLGVIQLACKYTLHHNELDNKRMTLDSIFKAFSNRFKQLLASCKQEHIDPVVHFEHFAFGMFKSFCDNHESTVTSTMTIGFMPPFFYFRFEEDIDKCPNDISQEILDLPPKTILDIYHAGESSDIPLDPDTLDVSPGPDLCNNSEPMLPTEISDLGHHQIHGSWAGLFMSNTTGRPIPYQGLMRIAFQNQPNQGGTMSGVASHYLENMDIKYVLNQTDNTHYDVQFLIKEETIYRSLRHDLGQNHWSYNSCTCQWSR